MRDINRIDVFCDDLKELWKKYPDLRFGQFIENFFEHVGPTAAYYMEETELLNKLTDYYKDSIYIRN